MLSKLFLASLVQLLNAFIKTIPTPGLPHPPQARPHQLDERAITKTRNPGKARDPGSKSSHEILTKTFISLLLFFLTKRCFVSK